jgi:hypothetical protein
LACIPEGFPISKLITAIPTDAEPYQITFEHAKRIVAAGDGRWKGRNKLYLTPDKSKRGLWAVVGQAAMYSEGVALGPKFGTLQLT